MSAAPGPSDLVAVGVDVGGTKILTVVVPVPDRPAAGVTVPAGVVPLATVQRPTPRDSSDIVDAIADAVGAAVRHAGLTVGSVGSIGVGLAGFIGRDGIAARAPNAPGLVGVDIPGVLRRRFAVPVSVDNDANCAAWAARCIDAPDARDLVAVTFGTGIGGGLVVGGKLVRGANGFAGEPGHMIVAVDGPPCVCGQCGCWEVFASGRALGRRAREVVASGAAPTLLAAAWGDLERVDGPLVSRLAAEGDRVAMSLLGELARWGAVGVANLINLMDPEVVILSGGVVGHGEVVLDRIRAELALLPTVSDGRDTRVLVADLGPSAGAVGAALLSLELAHA